MEQKAGSSWYPVVGRQVRLAAGTPWRISNGLVRLTSLDGATDSKIEVYNGAQWESQNIRHAYYSAGSVVRGGKIGQAPRAGTTVSLSVLRNAPETVVVRLAGNDEVITWSIQRGCYFVTMLSNSVAYAGLIYSTNTGMSASRTGTCQRRTAADASGNGLCFAAPWTSPTADLVQGGVVPIYLYPMAVGLMIDDVTAAGAEARHDEWLGPAMLSQRVIVR